MTYYRYIDLLCDLFFKGKELSVRGLKIKELIDTKLILNKINYFDFYPVRSKHITSKYLFGELAWYFANELHIENISKYSKFWKKLKDDFGEVNSNYGHLVFYKENKYGYTPFNYALDSLIKDLNSRQSIVLYNDKDYYYVGNKDFVCTTSQQFFVRNNKLMSIINIRSSDAIFGLFYDIIWWSLIQQQILLSLDNKDIILGDLIINIGSSHIYENKFELVYNMLNNSTYNEIFIQLNKLIELNHTFEWYEHNLKKYVNFIFE